MTPTRAPGLDREPDVDLGSRAASTNVVDLTRAFETLELALGLE